MAEPGSPSASAPAPSAECSSLPGSDSGLNAPSVAANSDGAAKNYVPRTLLLVDDEEGIRRVLGLTLADQGYSVSTAASGEEALAVYKEQRPAIVLTDIKMPGLGGVELLERLKALDPEVEVIMMTGHGDMDLAIQSLKLDATDFVLKPLRDDVLDVALRRATERIVMRRQLREYTENLEMMVRDRTRRLLEAERQLAARQAIDGMSHAMNALCLALDDGAEKDGGAGVFNQLPCFVAIHNSDLTIVTINQVYRERLGSLVGQPSWTVYRGRRKSDQLCPVRLAVETGRGGRSREVMVDKDGREVPVLVHTAPILDNEGEVELVLEIAVDVEESRRLQDELKAAQQRFQQLFDEAPCYITVQDRALRVLAANRRFRTDFGEPAAAQCHDIYAHSGEPCQQCPAIRTFEDGKPHQSEAVVTALDGRPRNVLISTAPLRDPEGNLSQVMEMSIDITQLRALQDRLTTLGLLLGTTAHGVKGQLTALDGGIYRLGSGLDRGDLGRVRDAHGDIRTIAGRIKKTVLDILYYAKERELNWTELDARAFLEGVAQVVQPIAAARGVDFFMELSPDLGTIEADEAALSSALVNLLENGVDACGAPRGDGPAGAVWLRAVPAAGGGIELAVADNGVGMDRATRERLFTLFFSSKGSGGTGIGLYLAKQIITQHGGAIGVESEPGKGSCFRVLLPATLPADAKAKPRDQETSNGGPAGLE